ncbi:unnamed protein product [Phytophthora lilii]|uniref:Unnamed protein product n=1 Tax=Phytophthora lilii TaxID=2077276 RepID=A0A9W6TIJ1_9STRA|nr:unnamed protein product [Phytophthora lilii]
MFSNLPYLSLIHLGIHLNLPRLPPLTGSLTLAWANQLREISSFSRVPNLSRLILSVLLRMDKLPDFAPRQNLVEFVVYRPNHICCNGFMGKCDLNHASCQANRLSNTSTATCLLNSAEPNLPITPFLGSTTTEHVFEKFSSSICQANLFDHINALLFPTKETINVCDGKPFRQCQFAGNIAGICYNTRFLPDANYIAPRYKSKKALDPRVILLKKNGLDAPAKASEYKCSSVDR